MKQLLDMPEFKRWKYLDTEARFLVEVWKETVREVPFDEAGYYISLPFLKAADKALDEAQVAQKVFNRMVGANYATPYAVPQ